MDVGADADTCYIGRLEITLVTKVISQKIRLGCLLLPPMCTGRQWRLPATNQGAAIEACIHTISLGKEQCEAQSY